MMKLASLVLLLCAPLLAESTGARRLAAHEGLHHYPRSNSSLITSAPAANATGVVIQQQKQQHLNISSSIGNGNGSISVNGSVSSSNYSTPACRFANASSSSHCLLSNASAITTPPGNFSARPWKTTSTEKCTPLPSDNRPITQYSIIYTSTVTFYGHRSDYTPPYERIKTPSYCTPSSSQGAPYPNSTLPTHRSNWTATAPLGSSATKSHGLVVPAPVPPVPTPIVVIPTPDSTDEDGGIQFTFDPFISFRWNAITFITTDKNPSVVFSDTVPAYSQTWLSGHAIEGNHKTVEAVDQGQPGASNTPAPANNVKLPPRPTFQVTAGGNQVVINDRTVTDLQPGKTTIVTVGSGIFTIFPSAVVGLGSTIAKPPPQETAAPAPTPSPTVLEGVSVSVSGSQAVIGGTTFTIPPERTTTSLNGRAVVLGPGTIAVGSETLTFQGPASRPTNEIVSGGEILTAIGKSILVLHSTTITYGRNIPKSETVVNGETISIGPHGVSLHGTTVGGPSAAATDTRYEIVGGITVGKLPPSLVVVNGATYTIKSDDDDDPETTVIGNETITIGPSGLIVSSMTLNYPPGASVTTTLSPSGTWASNFPTETVSQDSPGGGGDDDNDDNDDDSGAFSRRPDGLVGVTCLSIAIGVWILG